MLRLRVIFLNGYILEIESKLLVYKSRKVYLLSNPSLHKSKTIVYDKQDSILHIPFFFQRIFSNILYKLQINTLNLPVINHYIFHLQFITR